MPRSAAALLRDARTRARLSQRALAARARTAQSVVARIELGETSPAWDTLETLLNACGFDLATSLAPGAVARSHMLSDVPRILALTPEQRIREVANVDRFLKSARRV
jgi:transcriptional regulator with XRE-family HTH domain